MKYTGLILKESLQDETVLKYLTETKVEVWDVKRAEGNQPIQWTAIYFEIEKERVDEVSELLSKALKPKEWYINISGENIIIVIFPNKVFKYKKGDLVKRKEAIEYGKTVNIPEKQLDWSD